VTRTAYKQNKTNQQGVGRRKKKEERSQRKREKIQTKIRQSPSTLQNTTT
jgi:hypothetical protein